MGIYLRSHGWCNGCCNVVARHVCPTKTYAELKHKQELEQGGATQQKRISEMLTDLKKSVDEQGASNLISFDIGMAKSH